MARIVRFHAFGGPEVLRLEAEPCAEPAADQVRIRVAAFGLNRVEAIYRQGGFGPVEFPARIGYEAAGVVDAVGSGVTRWQPGDRVAVLPGLSMERYGTAGESLCYPAEWVVAVPPEQSLLEAAASWMQYLTAYALVAVGHAAPRQRIVITAASSSVGLAAIQIANAVGAVPLAVTRTRDKAAALRQLGAAAVIVSDEESVAARLQELAPAGADIVFDAVGGAGMEELIAALRPGGCLILYGNLAGDLAEAVAVPAQLLMLRNLSLRGFSANSLLEDPATRRQTLDYIGNALASGQLRPVIDRTFKLAEIAEAHRYLEGNTQVGKVVVSTGLFADDA